MRPVVLFLFFILSCATHFSFQDAERSGTIDAYYRFITENPDSPDVETARKRIQDMLFTEAVSKRDVLLIKRFISEFPQDSRTKNLMEILDEIRFENAKKRGTREGLELYLIENPEGRYRAEAKSLLEEMEFRRLIENGDIHEIEQFLGRNKGSMYSQRLNERLEELYFSRINKGDLRRAGEFLKRFPDSKKRSEVIALIFESIVDLAGNYCIIPNTDVLLASLNRDGYLPEILNSFKNRIEEVRVECERLTDFIENPVRFSVFKKGETGFLNKKLSEEDRKTLMTYLKGYYISHLQRVSLLKEMDSQIPSKRIDAFKRVMNYPLTFDGVSIMINRFFVSPIYERLEIYDSIKAATIDDLNRRVIEIYFFLNREKSVYNTIRNILFPEFEGYEGLNTFLNSSYSDTKEDPVLEYLIISIAYNEGQNSFIKSIFQEHLRSLFSKASEAQSMCSEECPQNILFDIKGIERIMSDEERYVTTIFGEDSDIYKIISEKKKEISSLLQRHQIKIESVKYEEFTKSVDIERMKSLIQKDVFRILFKNETDPVRRERMRKIILKTGD